ncbi:MAG: hypothetical protein B7X50_13505 [Alishewanella sp. 34-51-39]|nr:MAG: hypothetical protein B7X50_13505 [Alishewanella sp. 34-51-39]
MNVTKLHEAARIPEQVTPGSAGYDLCSVTGATIYPGQRLLIKTGLSVAIPDGMVGIIKPRSGLALKHGIDTLAGVADSDFRGELGVLLINHGDAPWQFNAGERVAQLVVVPCYHGACVEVGSLEETMRGDGAYGSTGA